MTAPSSSKVQVWNRALAKIGSTVRLQDEDSTRVEAQVCQDAWEDILREFFEARQWPWAIRQIAPTEITTQSTTYAGDDSQVNFLIPFAFSDPATLTVTLIAVGGAETVQTAGAGADFTLHDDPVYIVMGAAPATGESLRVEVTYEREGWTHLFSLPNDFVQPVCLLPDGIRPEQITPEAMWPFAILLNDAADGLILATNAVLGSDFDKIAYVGLIDNPSVWPRTFVDAVAIRLAVELAFGVKKDAKLGLTLMQAAEAALDKAGAYAGNAAGHEPEALTPSLLARGDYYNGD